MRCIFLLSSNLDPAIQKFRSIHDPQSDLVPPHITVVFPFDVPLTDDELMEHCHKQISGLKLVEVKLGTVSIEPNGYVFFLFVKGSSEITEIHNRLNSGPLADQFNGTSFKPHMTIARFNDGNRVEVAKATNLLQPVQNFLIDQIVIEEVETNGRSREITKILLPE
jgi:2'-5' RNA ligase